MLPSFLHDSQTWRPIPGYPGYWVSRHGQVYSDHQKKGLLKPFARGGGYVGVRLYKPTRESKCFLLHVLVAAAFLPKQPTPLHELNHINTIKTDCRAANLEWTTRGENLRHAGAHGLLSRDHRGERNPNARLTAERVRLIRRYGAVDGVPRSLLAHVFDVSHRAVGDILSGRRWAA